MKIIFFFFLLSTIAFAANYKAPISVTATTTPAKVLELNPNRCALTVLNKGSFPVIMKSDSAQVGTEGILIPAQGNWEPFSVPKNSFYLKSSSSTSAVIIIEGDC